MLGYRNISNVWKFQMEEKVEPSIGELIGRIEAALEAEAKNDELSALRNEVAALKSVEAERNEARREARLTLAQLHHSQKELQHYFELCRQQSELLERSFRLLSSSIN